jgi:hypothetical protein
VAELNDNLELDLGRNLEDDDEDEIAVKYPLFSKAVAKKAEMFKEEKGYRTLCLVPSFILGLCMVGRIKRHYNHALWFTVRSLVDMIGDYGGVSEIY